MSKQITIDSGLSRAFVNSVFCVFFVDKTKNLVYDLTIKRMSWLLTLFVWLVTQFILFFIAIPV